MKTKIIEIPILIKLTSVDTEGELITKNITEYDLETADIGDFFYPPFRTNAEPALEEILELVGYDEEAYYATRTIYQNDILKEKELIIFKSTQ